MWVIPSSIKETLLGWNDSFVGKKCQKVWKAVPLCLFWMVWKERNKIAFKKGGIFGSKIEKFFCL